MYNYKESSMSTGKTEKRIKLSEIECFKTLVVLSLNAIELKNQVNTHVGPTQPNKKTGSILNGFYSKLKTFLDQSNCGMVIPRSTAMLRSHIHRLIPNLKEASNDSGKIFEDTHVTKEKFELRVANSSDQVLTLVNLTVENGVGLTTFLGNIGPRDALTIQASNNEKYVVRNRKDGKDICVYAPSRYLYKGDKIAIFFDKDCQAELNIEKAGMSDKDISKLFSKSSMRTIVKKLYTGDTYHALNKLRNALVSPLENSKWVIPEQENCLYILQELRRILGETFVRYEAAIFQIHEITYRMKYPGITKDQILMDLLFDLLHQTQLNDQFTFCKQDQEKDSEQLSTKSQSHSETAKTETVHPMNKNECMDQEEDNYNFMSSIDTYSSFKDSTISEQSEGQYIIDQQLQDEIFSGENKLETASFVHSDNFEIYTASSFNFEGEFVQEEEISSSQGNSLIESLLTESQNTADFCIDPISKPFDISEYFICDENLPFENHFDQCELGLPKLIPNVMIDIAESTSMMCCDNSTLNF